MRAVAAGYLNYKDCDLEGKALDTLEAWSISSLRNEDTMYLRKAQLDISGALLHLGGEQQERLESIQELWSDLTSGILGVTKETSASTDDKYREVFGDVTEAEVQELNQHLEDKALILEQEEMSKKQAMERLEQELGTRFRNRIT